MKNIRYDALHIFKSNINQRTFVKNVSASFALAQHAITLRNDTLALSTDGHILWLTVDTNRNNVVLHCYTCLAVCEEACGQASAVHMVTHGAAAIFLRVRPV